MPDLEILGVHEMAQLAGVSDSTMRAYVTRKQCPDPDYRLACGPIWRRDTATAWVAKRDDRINRMQRQAAKEIERETKAATEYVKFHMIGESNPDGSPKRGSRSEVVYRNRHNRRAASPRSYRTRMPTVVEEARSIAEGLIGSGDSSLPPGLLIRHDWANGLLSRRANHRLGAPDGIPF